ncbi:DUF2203 domain-containing protein [Paenibacillus filicis]|uniref:DUF2203 domain-containing protein n=1 Tax=Paenibacillus filicis TaxID=669464 RepID=A0ABU9DEH6_9BACL
MSDKLFTIEEANELLPELMQDLHQLQEMTGSFEELYTELQKNKAKWKRAATPAKEMEDDPFFEAESRLEFMRMEVELFLQNFGRKGVLLKMINPGLIDFPAVVDGEDVLLCWKQGEERVTHYHSLYEGFVGRKLHPDA